MVYKSWKYCDIEEVIKLVRSITTEKNHCRYKRNKAWVSFTAKSGSQYSLSFEKFTTSKTVKNS